MTTALSRLSFGSASREDNVRLEGALGFAGLLLAWQLAIACGFSGHGTIASPMQILRQFFVVDGPGFYFNSAASTLHAAAQGWCWGVLLACVFGVLLILMPVLEAPVMLLGTVSYCLPMVAIGPVLVIVASEETPRVTLAALAVFFPMLVGVHLGLRSANKTVLDVIHAFGGGNVTQMMKVRWRAALPQFFASLRVSAPSALLGAIIGEFLGAESGLGVVLINSQQALNYPRTWTLVVFSAVLASAAYALIRFVGAWVTPWARETHSNLAASTVERGSTRSTRVKTILIALAKMALSFLLVLAVWWLLLKAFNVPNFIGKGPADVWAYLFDPDSGADNRSALASESLTTLRDAGLGLFCGTVAALVAAGLFEIFPVLGRMLIAPALSLQSVPLVAITPLIVLVFGRQLETIAIIGSSITFFPMLVNITQALARTPKESTDLMRVFGASEGMTLLKVRIPYALPAVFASLRIAAPLSITGALLAEWLATGNGLGYSVMTDVATSDYDGVWTRVALATFYSLLLYNGVGLVERWLNSR